MFMSNSGVTKRVWQALACGVGLMLSAGSWADEQTVSVVQEKIYDRDHEIGFQLGYIPDDDFYQSFPLGGNYLYHFDDHLAWEVVRAQWSINTDRDIKDRLIQDYAVVPEEFDALQYLVHTSLVIKPTYGKDSIWNAGILNHEGFLSVGIGFAGYERDYSFGPSTTERAISLAFGLGRKYFISQSLSVNLELRDYLIFKDEATENNIYLGLGLAYRFNMAPRKAAAENEDHSIYRYLRDDHDAR
jgi:outer membrane beta-barrel protein